MDAPPGTNARTARTSYARRAPGVSVGGPGAGTAGADAGNDGMSRLAWSWPLLAAGAFAAGAIGAAPSSAGAQPVRPAPTGPVNVIRPSSPLADPAADTTPTVFFAGPRPAPAPATDVPGHELVTWRSSSPLVRGVAGADAAYLAAFGGADGRVVGVAEALIGRLAGPVFVGGGGWPGWLGGGRRHHEDTPAAPVRTVQDRFPRPWIGGVRWDLPQVPIEPPPRNAAVYPVRRR